MERFFKLLYYYCLGLLVFVTVYMVAMLAAAPKNDALNRGFIPCTRDFVTKVSDCGRGELSCMAAGIWQDTKCNLYVIFDGAGAWLRGKQPTPWANYLFEPKSEAEIDTENQYIGVISQDVGVLEAQRQFMENRQKELEEAKHRSLNLDKNVLPADDAEPNGKYDTKEEAEPAQPDENSDIDEEAFLEDFEPEAENAQKAETPVSENEKTKALLKQNAQKSTEKKGEINDK